MADDATPRDRQIRTEALHIASIIAAAVVTAGESYDLANATHVYAHYLHSGVWLGDADGDGKADCPFGDYCRFNRKAA